nr:hypothetical protein [Tanacetum cinerariifolium]
MQIISALQARTLLSHGCEGFLATIHDTTSGVPSIHDQPIVSELPDVFLDELPRIPPVREMVNTRTDTDLSAAVQNALQALLPQIREEIHEEFRTGSRSLNAGGNIPPVTIHTWLERFNKQKPHS